MSRFLGLDFKIAVFAGLAGIPVCSMLGGMKAVTWTQVAQYTILIVAYLIPPVVMSQKLTGVPIPAIMYGQVLQQIDAREKAINSDPRVGGPRPREPSRQTRNRRQEPPRQPRCQTLRTGGQACGAAGRYAGRGAGNSPEGCLQFTRGRRGSRGEMGRGRKTATGLSKQVKPYLQPFARLDMKNMLALTFCLMVGTAGLPHILTRYYTVPSVRAGRMSAGWSLFFISLLYFTAPAVAAFGRNEVLSNVIGLPIASLRLGSPTGARSAWSPSGT